jgi:DNA gyrase/topoisomerase IV subunit B
MPVHLNDGIKIQELLNYYMGDNNEDRKNFIIDNLIVETNEEDLLVA